MTYLQLMMKCLSFFKNEEDGFDIDDFYFYWFHNKDADVDLYYKSRAKKAIMYLFLLETKGHCDVDGNLIKLLEKELSFFDVSLFSTLNKSKEKTVESIVEDPYMYEQLCLLAQDQLTEDELNEIVSELFNGFQEQLSEGWETEQYESAIHTVMEMVSQIIPELFFTEKGYRYIDQEYQIADTNLRKRCYEYLKDNIRYYNSERIYNVDKKIYNELYGAEKNSYQLEDLDDECLEEFDYDDSSDEVIRGEVNIYGIDIDNYDILYYSVTLLVTMLRLIKNGQYDKIEKLIKIDEQMTDEHNICSSYCDKTLIESIYQPKTMDCDYHNNISTLSKSDFCLDFFLSNNEFTQRYNISQLALIILYCFDFFDLDPLNKISKNIEAIDSVLGVNDPSAQACCFWEEKNKEKIIKQFVKIRDNQ